MDPETLEFVQSLANAEPECILEMVSGDFDLALEVLQVGKQEIAENAEFIRCYVEQIQPSDGPFEAFKREGYNIADRSEYRDFHLANKCIGDICAMFGNNQIPMITRIIRTKTGYYGGSSPMQGNERILSYKNSHDDRLKNWTRQDGFDEKLIRLASLRILDLCRYLDHLLPPFLTTLEDLRCRLKQSADAGKKTDIC